MATGTHNLGDYTIEDDGNNDYVIKDPQDNIIFRWDESAGEWTLNTNPLTGVSALGGLSGNNITSFEGSNLSVDGGGNLTATDTDTRTDVSNGGSTVVQDTEDINFGLNLDVSDDGDGSVTVDSANSATTTTIDDTDSPYTTSDEDIIYCDTSAGAVTVTLASSDATLANDIRIVNIDATNAVTVDTESTETIDPNAESSKTINNAGWAVTFVSDGSNWDTTLEAEFDSVNTDGQSINESILGIGGSGRGWRGNSYNAIPQTESDWTKITTDNPLVEVGSGWDSGQVEDTQAIRDGGDNYEWALLYHGSSSGIGDIGLATADTLTQIPWDKNANNPVISRSAFSQLDGERLRPLGLIKSREYGYLAAIID